MKCGNLPRQHAAELIEKKTLYFAAGADEVWLCYRDGRVEFFRKEDPEAPVASVRCPAFPDRLA